MEGKSTGGTGKHTSACERNYASVFIDILQYKIFRKHIKYTVWTILHDLALLFNLATNQQLAQQTWLNIWFNNKSISVRFDSGIVQH